MKRSSPLDYKTAFILAASISLLMNILFIIMFFYHKPPARENEGFQHLFRLSAMLTRIFINFLAAFLLYLVNFWLLRRERFAREKALVALVVLACMVIISCAGSLAQALAGDFGPPPGRALVGGLFRDCFVAIVVILSSQLIYISNKQQKTALENETLQGEYMKTRFMALKNQVDPHFLFNSLNTLSSLIKTDADKAGEYVQQLSRVFRHTLQNKEIITLEEELEFTLAYCHLMQIRYGDNLRFIREVDRRYYPCSIVPLSLQTLVENAIKHNVVSNKQPLSITFSTSDDATITVSNPVQPKKDAGEGESIGLSNLAERYRLLWNKEIVIRDTGGVFDVEIPLIV
jgi:signal transduction histidine kinase